MGAVRPLDLRHLGVMSPRSPRGERLRRQCGCGERTTRTNSPRSAPPGTPWRVRAPCAPEFATIRVPRQIVANSSVLRPCPAPLNSPRSGCSRQWGCGERATRTNSPQSAPPGTPWRVRASCAPQLATIRVPRQIVASLSALRRHAQRSGAAADRGEFERPVPCAPQFATVRVQRRIVAGSSVLCPSIRHGPGPVADCGGFGRPVPLNSPRSGCRGGSWRVTTSRLR
jgi:hypothetical protein